MNGPMVRALLEDAYHQVLDNRIFRMLLIVVLGLVAPTFLVGFREHELKVLWGWQTLPYERFFEWFSNQSPESIKDVQGEAIRIYQELIVDTLCGNLGMVFCVAATAFFVPRMLEKGSADVLFSKPLSRFALFMARYLSGILFVALLVVVLVTGMYLGFLIVSGYNDPSILWSALTMIYLFAIIHGVSMLAGVMTRSTVAAMLIALVFFMGTGCVHSLWWWRAHVDEAEDVIETRERIDESQGEEVEVATVLDQDPGTFWKILVTTLDVLHYTLPKTSDAELITAKLRRALERKDRILVDGVVHLTVRTQLAGFEVETEGLPKAEEGKIPVDLAARPAVWTLVEEGRETARIEISRHNRLSERPGSTRGEKRMRRLPVGTFVDEWLERIQTEGGASEKPSTHKGAVDGAYAMFLDWSGQTAGRDQHHHGVVFASGDWFVQLHGTADASWMTPEERAERFEEFVAGLKIAREAEFVDSETWYERRFGWTAPLPFNVYFSIASSVAFTLVVMLIAALKLARIDF